MSTNKIYKFSDITQAQYFLNGAIFGGNVVPGSGSAAQGFGGNPNNVGVGISGLVGKTLIFTSPAAGTVTFTASSVSGNPDPNSLQPSDIKAQIEAVATGVRVSFWGGRLVIQEVTPTSGVAITSAGTANGILGFDTNQASTGKIYAPPGVSGGAVAPCWTWAYSTNDNGHVVYTLE
jgi:hypothetical protein